MNNFLSMIANKAIPTSGTKVKQTDRNQLKAQFMDLLTDTLKATITTDEVVIMRTADGIALAIDNKEIGDNGLTIIVNATVKDLDYDPYNEADCYDQDQAEKRIKAEALAKSKAKRIAEAKSKKT